MQALAEYRFQDIALAYQVVTGQRLPANAFYMTEAIKANLPAILAELNAAQY